MSTLASQVFVHTLINSTMTFSSTSGYTSVAITPTVGSFRLTGNGSNGTTTGNGATFTTTTGGLGLVCSQPIDGLTIDSASGTCIIVASM